MGTPINILMVEDSQDDITLLVAELKSSGFNPSWRQVDTEADFLEQLKTPPDIVFSDNSIPQLSGMRALQLLREQDADMPFILVSGTIGEERVAESMKAGATDYVLKDRLGRLAQVIRRALLEVRERKERRRFEKQFIEAQKMEVVALLASGVAHDFNNILAVIMGYGEVIMGALAAGDPAIEYAGEILQAADRAAALTRQLLLFSSKQTVHPAVLDLNAVVAEADRMLRRLIDENVELTFLACKELGHIKADAGHVGQILMNLVVNARDAMPDGGRIIIETCNAAPEATRGNEVMLSVRDTGTGMTEEVKTRLFEAFFTTKPRGKGTGLGLATCHTIVKQCGGHIEVDSEPGKGTTFKIYFPRVDQPLNVPAQRIRTGGSPRGEETLLFVEDEPSVRHLACNILESQGYHILRAHNGRDGLRVASEWKGEPVALVITDVIMPLMGGKAMSEWLQATYPGIKILFTSGYTDDAIEHEGVFEPGVAFLPKPYTPTALRSKVREMLDEEIPKGRHAMKEPAPLEYQRIIAQLKQTGDALHWTTAFLEATVNSSLDGILVVNSEGKKVLQSRRMVDLLKIPAHIADDPDDAKQLEWIINNVRNRGQFVEKVLWLNSHPDEISRDEIELKDGTTLDRYSSPVVGKDGTYYGRIWTFRDITAQKQFESRLLQSQKMETVGKLAGGIAHEFNSIMTAIIGQSELVLGDLPPESPLRHNVTEIRQAADRVATLTRQLLAYGRKQLLQPAVLDLNSLVCGMETVLRHLMATDVDVRVVSNPALKSVKVDGAQIEQVILNMAMNAADAMPNGGKLTLETANVTIDPEYAARFPDMKAGEYVMIAITDTGAGMSGEVKARIFEPFFSTKGIGNGTGLGLATCHGIIKQSGGHINVYSEPGRGAVFKIYLPQIDAQDNDAALHVGKPAMARGNETILLVEDDPALREMAATLLRRLGYTVLAAANGIDALGLTHEKGRGYIDLLFTDVVMPHMSGRELSDRIRSLYPRTKILFTSAYTENAIMHQGVLDRGVELLQKPFTPSELAGKIREILDR